MADNKKHLLHVKSSVATETEGAKLPSADVLDYGEIAVNYSEGYETLSIKNTSDEIATFTKEVQVGGETPTVGSPIQLFVDEDEEPLDVTLATKDELDAETTAREEADEEIEEKLDEKIRWYNSSKAPQYDSSEIVIDEDDDFTIDLYTKEEVDEKLNEIETNIDDKLDNLGNVLRGNETENVPTTVLVDEDASADISVYTTDQVDAKLEDMETEFDDKLDNLGNVLRGNETENVPTTVLVDEDASADISVYTTDQVDSKIAQVQSEIDNIGDSVVMGSEDESKQETSQILVDTETSDTGVMVYTQAQVDDLFAKLIRLNPSLVWE